MTRIRSEIIGCGSYLPGEPISNKLLSEKIAGKNCRINFASSSFVVREMRHGVYIFEFSKQYDPLPPLHRQNIGIWIW